VREAGLSPRGPNSEEPAGPKLECCGGRRGCSRVDGERGGSRHGRGPDGASGQRCSVAALSLPGMAPRPSRQRGAAGRGPRQAGGGGVAGPTAKHRTIHRLHAPKREAPSRPGQSCGPERPGWPPPPAPAPAPATRPRQARHAAPSPAPPPSIHGLPAASGLLWLRLLPPSPPPLRRWACFLPWRNRPPLGLLIFSPGERDRPGFARYVLFGGASRLAPPGRGAVAREKRRRENDKLSWARNRTDTAGGLASANGNARYSWRLVGLKFADADASR